MAFTTTDEEMPIKQELIEEKSDINYPMKSEQNHSNPWSIENAEKYLKYCCPECIFNTKDFQDFSKIFF